MNLKLVDIPGIEPADQTGHKIKALVVGEKSDALSALADWKQSSREDFKTMMRKLRVIGGVRDLLPLPWVKRDKAGEPVYEISAPGKNARLFFFLAGDDASVVVCTNAYWKTSSSRAQQDKAFAEARRLRELFLLHWSGTNG